jgi:hypothetical protein
MSNVPRAFTLLLLAVLSPAQITPGRIVGNIDGITKDTEQFFVSGWACQQRRKDSIRIQIFVHPANSEPGKVVFLTANQANFDSEPAVNRACQDQQGGKHRFFAVLPLSYHDPDALAIHGIRVVDGVPNDVIAGSDKPPRHLDRLEMPFPTPAVPPISGSYQKLDAHPRVFLTNADLKDLASRINRPGSYSAKRFAQLAAKMAQDLAAPNDWDAAYSGCWDEPYLYAFACEPQDGHDAETHAAMKLGPNAKAPAGGAVVAARLALYAALVKAGAQAPAGAANPDLASSLARRILLAWADHGFPRGAKGEFLPLSGLSCDQTGKPVENAGSMVPLQIGRGVGYSVYAQDLLQSIGAVNASEAARLDAMHAAVFELIRQGMNQDKGTAQPACQRFANGSANGLAALLAIARLLDDPRRFNAVLNGGDREIPVALPWTRFFNGAIYGEFDQAMDCYPNGPNGRDSGMAFTTGLVAPGEVQDRYRNKGDLQTFGYPMFTLERLINAAEILRGAGFDPWGYRGVRHQSIEMALQYYACYGKTPGFNQKVTLQNARDCANREQYEGKIVNGVDSNLLAGAWRIPQNAALASLESAAKEKAASGAFALDALLFGRWRD